jgi:hypothetical protein
MPKRRLQVDLSDAAYSRLEETAHEQGRPLAEVVRRALNIEDYLNSERKKGARVVIEEEDGTKRELVMA